MNRWGKLVLAGAVIFAAMQLVRPGIPARPVTAEVHASPAVREILDRSCYSCHSDERRLAWFDQIAPGYWLVRHDILTAREHLNFSVLGAQPAAAQRAALFEAVNMIQLGAMPLRSFTALHRGAKVTPEELATMKRYLAPWGSTPSPVSAKAADVSPGISREINLAAVRPELNGFPFDPEFESWKPISMTDRGDNNTFRFVLGNDIAVKAAESGHISPWPDGTRFAKIAWAQETGADGMAHPGRFIQVELMLKDRRQYRDTDGWGWGRWRGLDLQPYGKNAHFVNECTGCHLPVRGNDYVYTLPITPAHHAGDEVLNNHAANLPKNLPYQPLAWNAITMYVDPRAHTMATLYGNTTAMLALRGGPNRGGGPAYPAGAVLALVTWTQRDDPHWFGARIPDIPRSVEFLQFAVGQPATYRSFAGSTLVEEHLTPEAVTQRTGSILALAPADLP